MGIDEKLLKNLCKHYARKANIPDFVGKQKPDGIKRYSTKSKTLFLKYFF